MKSAVPEREVSRIEEIAPYSEKVSHTVVMGTPNGSANILSFRRGQGLPTHRAPADAMVYVMHGHVQFMFDDKTLDVHAGEFFTMREGTEHHVHAVEDSRVMLFIVKPA